MEKFYLYLFKKCYKFFIGVKIINIYNVNILDFNYDVL